MVASGSKPLIMFTGFLTLCVILQTYLSKVTFANFFSNQLYSYVASDCIEARMLYHSLVYIIIISSSKNLWNHNCSNDSLIGIVVILFHE